jgi:hypothetical protein
MLRRGHGRAHDPTAALPLAALLADFPVALLAATSQGS